VYSQASRSNYRGYFHVLKYILFIVIIILRSKGVMHTNRLSDVISYRNIFAKLSQNLTSASLRSFVHYVIHFL